MATFEERELIDYTIKKLEKALEPENFMIKDLDKMHNRLKRTEERLRKIIEKIESLENRIRSLERENIFSKSSSESSSDSKNKIIFSIFFEIEKRMNPPTSEYPIWKDNFGFFRKSPALRQGVLYSFLQKNSFFLCKFLN